MNLIIESKKYDEVMNSLADVLTKRAWEMVNNAILSIADKIEDAVVEKDVKK